MNDEIVKIFPTGALWAKKGISGSGSDQRRGGAGFVRGADAIPSLEDASPEYLGGGREGGSGGGDQDEDEDDGESRKNFDSSRVETGLLGGDVRDGDGVVTIECGEGFDAWSMTFSDDSSMLLGGGGADGGVSFDSKRVGPIDISECDALVLFFESQGTPHRVPAGVDMERATQHSNHRALAGESVGRAIREADSTPGRSRWGGSREGYFEC